MTASATTVTVAAVQMVSKVEVSANLRDAAELIGRAARAGARLVVLPEYFCIMGRSDRDKVAARERDGDGPIQQFLAAEAAKHGIWLVGGTTPIDTQQARWREMAPAYTTGQPASVHRRAVSGRSSTTATT